MFVEHIFKDELVQDLRSIECRVIGAFGPTDPLAQLITSALTSEDLHLLRMAKAAYDSQCSERNERMPEMVPSYIGEASRLQLGIRFEGRRTERSGFGGCSEIYWADSPNPSALEILLPVGISKHDALEMLHEAEQFLLSDWDAVVFDPKRNVEENDNDDLFAAITGGLDERRGTGY